jgi:hypothetical protein
VSGAAPAVERRRVLPELDVVLLRATIVLGVAVTGVAAQVAGSRPAPWAQAVLLGLGVWTALRPESIAGVAVLGAAAYVWAVGPDPGSPLVLAVAAGMVLTHVAALVAAQGPARMHLDPVQVRRWAARGVLLWLASAGVWGLGTVLADLPHHRLAYAVGLFVVVVLAGTGTALFGARPARTSELLSRPRGAA